MLLFSDNLVGRNISPPPCDRREAWLTSCHHFFSSCYADYLSLFHCFIYVDPPRCSYSRVTNCLVLGYEIDISRLIIYWIKFISNCLASFFDNVCLFGEHVLRIGRYQASLYQDCILISTWQPLWKATALQRLLPLLFTDQMIAYRRRIHELTRFAWTQ